MSATAANPFKTDKAVFTPSDFILWQQNEMLEEMAGYFRISIGWNGGPNRVTVAQFPSTRPKAA